MTIDQVTEAKQKLQDKFQALITEFENSTGLKPSCCIVPLVGDEEPRHNIRVTVKL